MSDPTFECGDIKKMMCVVIYKLEKAGYGKEADAVADLTHIIAGRIEPHDVSHPRGVDYLIECLEHHESLIKYLHDE